MLKFSRWVERKDKVVTFGNIAGPYLGKPYTYFLPTIALAETLEALAKSAELSETGENIPAAIPSETWEIYRQK